MNAPSVESPGWTRGRWLRAVGLAFGAQLALIFAFGERGPTPLRPARPSTVTLWPGGARLEPVPYENPVLLVLPGEQGYSGPAWMRVPPLARPEQTWTEPPRWLPLTPETLGGISIRTSEPPPRISWEFAGKPPPQPATPQEPDTPRILAAESRLVLEGDLAGWPLLNAPPLPTWPGEDVLSSSVVQVQVDGLGQVFSAVLLAGSGLPQADQRALELAMALRFVPRPAATTNEWARGIVRFEWHTLPVAMTNQTPPR